MSTLALIKPLPLTVLESNYAGAERVLTPDPKEALFISGSGHITLDAGAPVTADTLLLGYHSALADQDFAAYATDASGNGFATLADTSPLRPLGLGPPNHAFARSLASITSRYWQVQFNTGSQNIGYSVGVIALGQAFQVQYGAEWGGGRSIDDTGSVERLFSGGFSIDEGVSAGGYQWTFGDLQPDELRQLYQLVKERRTTRSILVVEDPDQTDGLNERLHWGLFRKLEPYERRAAANTRWALQVADWA